MLCSSCCHSWQLVRGTEHLTTDLLLVNLEGVSVLHLELFNASVLAYKQKLRQMSTHRFRVISGVDSLAVEKESHTCGALALALAEGVHELLELGGALDLEVNFVVVVGHLDVQVLAAFRLLRRCSSVRHCDCSVVGSVFFCWRARC